jgi:hypothetical protein
VTKKREVRIRAPLRRFVEYLKKDYPIIFTLGRFGKWGLTLVKRAFFGITGIAILAIAGLYIAGALIEPARWYLVGIASALLLLGGGLLALSYIKLYLDRSARNLSQLAKRQSDVNRKLWFINKRVSDTKKGVSHIKEALGTIEATVEKTNRPNDDDAGQS